MTKDLGRLSIDELKALQTDISKAISTLDARRRDSALAELQAVAEARGFALADLLGTKLKKKRPPVAQIYANPADKNETWSGRGRRPRWADAALKAGRSLDEFRI